MEPLSVLCLLLAQGLRRRLSAAWALTLVLLLELLSNSA